jgi:hypothetical protein
MFEFKKFPDIGQFRNVIKTVRTHHNYKGVDDEGEAIYHNTSPYPTLKFQGTVKLHGSNGAIGIDDDGNVWTQSRNRILTPEDDNAGFARFVSDLDDEVFNLMKAHGIVIYGEWCGGSIQKKVALNKLPKMFVIFAVKGLTIEGWTTESFSQMISDSDLTVLNANNIYLINQFPVYEIEIDFNHPELVQNELVEITSKVGDCCPVGWTLGVEGTGEGVVWKCMDGNFDSSRFWFKVKDERHQASKVKTLAPVDTEKVKNLQEFVANTVTESRLQQGIDYLQEMNIPLDIKSTGDFLRWVFNDILKEESDTMEENGLNKKDIGSPISRAAKIFWMKKLNEQIGL